VRPGRAIGWYLRITVYFFRLLRCGGPEMAPALPQSADNRPRTDRSPALPQSADNRPRTARSPALPQSADNRPRTGRTPVA